MGNPVGDPATRVTANLGLDRFFSAGLRSLVCVPLISQDEAMGVLALWSTRTDVYADRQLQLAERVGAQIAGAIVNAQLYSELQCTEATMRSIVDGSVDGIITVDQAGLIESFNPSAQRMFGYCKGEVSGRNINLLISEPDRDAGVDHVGEHLQVGRPEIVGVIREVLGRRKDASTFPLELSASEARLDDRRLFTCVVRDISERRRADEALRESEERFRLLVENAGNAFFLHDVTGTIIDVNQRACDSLGYTRAELLAPLSMSDIDLAPGNGSGQEALGRLNSGVGVAPSGAHRRKDGSTFPVEVRLATFNWRDRPLYLALARDVTQRKALENQLIEAQKMEAVGRLAGGIAHDFNNLLTGIQGYCHLGRMKLTDPEQLEGYIDRIDRAAERASDLTRQLLAFSRRQIFEPRVINLNGMIGEMDQMLRGLITENIEVVVEPDPDLGLVKVDPGQMEQVLINLAVNARDVMPEGGVLTVRTASVRWKIRMGGGIPRSLPESTLRSRSATRAPVSHRRSKSTSSSHSSRQRRSARGRAWDSRPVTASWSRAAGTSRWTANRTGELPSR